MKVVILGKGSMLSNLIRGVMLANCEIAGVFRYERLKFHPFVLKLYDFFKSSSEYTLIKKHKFRDLAFNSANSDAFKRFLIRENIDLVIRIFRNCNFSRILINCSFSFFCYILHRYRFIFHGRQI